MDLPVFLARVGTRPKAAHLPSDEGRWVGRGPQPRF